MNAEFVIRRDAAGKKPATYLTQQGGWTVEICHARKFNDRTDAVTVLRGRKGKVIRLPDNQVSIAKPKISRVVIEQLRPGANWCFELYDSAGKKRIEGEVSTIERAFIEARESARQVEAGVIVV